MGSEKRTFFQIILTYESTSFSAVAAGCVVTRHSHPQEQAGLVLAGEITVTIGDETRLVKTGEIYFIPGGVEHSMQVGDQPAKVLDVFGPESDG